MSRSDLQAVKIEYVALAAYYGRTIDDLTLRMYADDLEDLDGPATLRAMRHIRREHGRRTCPLPIDIIGFVRPSATDFGGQAHEIAGRIVSSVSRFGYTNPAGAQAHIGKIGWLVVERKGGWEQLCRTLLAKEMGTFFAQCRDLAAAELKAQARSSAMEPEQPLLTDALRLPRAIGA